jgi:signal peptidase I
MEPALKPGDRVLLSPLVYGALTPFSAKKIPGFAKPKRGEIVLVLPPYAKRLGPLAAFLDSMVRFVSFQRLGAKDQAVIKRVVGVPGDVVSLKDSVISVNPGGNSRFLTEFELAKKPYDLYKLSLPESWDGSLPFSGKGAEVKLGPGQYYVMNDNRSVSSDSRSWGPLAENRIVGKVFFRFWPLFR